jgi:hypothetical protein
VSRLLTQSLHGVCVGAGVESGEFINVVELAIFKNITLLACWIY